ncbi:MAG: hypothetical protein JXP34_01140 [Planctomycetes bacterium]|nr:hypothetical protein [Planctomycetota bacterium]
MSRPTLRGIDPDLGEEIRVAAGAPRLALGGRPIAIGTLAVVAGWLSFTAIASAELLPALEGVAVAGVWALLWTVAGAAIARLSAVSLARGERLAGCRAVAFGLRVAPTCVLGWGYGAAAAALPAGLAFGGGWLAGCVGRGLAIAWWCGPGAILIAAATCAIVGLALAVALLPSATSIDSPFAFDLFARAVSYARHRPGRAAVLSFISAASAIPAAAGFAGVLVLGLVLLRAGTESCGLEWPGIPLPFHVPAEASWVAGLCRGTGAGPLLVVTGLVPALGAGYLLASIAAGLTVAYAALRRTIDALPLAGILPGEEGEVREVGEAEAGTK